jgi:hypothetical protein
LATPPYPYVVFYEATETEIIIHAVRHQAPKPFRDARRSLSPQLSTESSSVESRKLISLYGIAAQRDGKYPQPTAYFA